MIEAKIAHNLLNREFTATQPNKKWVSDLTYIGTAEGWLYLAAILDLYSRRVVGWAMSDSLHATLGYRGDFPYGLPYFSKKLLNFFIETTPYILVLLKALQMKCKEPLNDAHQPLSANGAEQSGWTRGSGVF